MPTVYASGTPNSDGYLSGIAVATTQALLGSIRDTLVAAGWTVDDSQILGNRIECIGVDNTDNCWVNFFLTNVAANEYLLHVQGDLDGTGVTLSPDFVTLQFFEGAQARLYLTADEAGGCIFIQNGSSGGQSAHFGFLERLTDSPYSWMVAPLTSYVQYSYIARDIWNVNWSEMARYWYQYNSEGYRTGANQHLWDSYTVAHSPNTDYNTKNTAANSKQNPAYMPWLGAVDSVTGLPILSDYGYIIGRNDNRNDYVPPNYGLVNEGAIPLHFPGRVRFARTGLASVDAGDQFIVDTKTVISGGAIGLYQGFVIKDTI